MKGKLQGFTIVELLIVIVVLAILVVLCITTVAGISSKKNDESSCETYRNTTLENLPARCFDYFRYNGK